MRARFLLVAAAACGLAFSLDGCFTAELARDGAGCSDEATCPPDQTCSADGQCLFTCPFPDCVDDVCGCSSPNGYRPADETVYRCLPDGLCHLLCQGEPGSCGCPGRDAEMRRGPDDVCRPSCANTQSCPNGAECVESPDLQLYCHAVDATPIP